MYAKLINNQIEFAQVNKPLETGGMIFNYGEDINLLKKDGFLLYQEDEMPILTEGQSLSFEYVQNANEITKKYEVVNANV